MQRSYVVKSPINFANFSFFVKIGDILVHDPANVNKLTVYRNGEIVKAIAQTPLGMAAILKQGFIAELGVAPTTAPATPPKPVEAPKKATPAPGVSISKEDFEKLKKRGKKEPKEVKETSRVAQEDPSVDPPPVDNETL